MSNIVQGGSRARGNSLVPLFNLCIDMKAPLSAARHFTCSGHIVVGPSTANKRQPRRWNCLAMLPVARRSICFMRNRLSDLASRTPLQVLKGCSEVHSPRRWGKLVLRPGLSVVLTAPRQEHACMVKEHVLQTETATMQSSVLARRVDAAWWCRAAEEPEELDHGIRPRMRCISGVRVVDGQFGTSGMQGATFQLLQSGNVVNLPLKRKSCKMEVTKQHRLGRRWGRGILHCRSSRGLKAWFDQESEVSRTKLTRRKSLVFAVEVPGWSARIVSLLGTSPIFARPLATTSRQSACALLRDAQQVCAELRPKVRALASAAAWHKHEESELLSTRSLVGVLAALVPLETNRESLSIRELPTARKAMFSVPKPQATVPLAGWTRRSSAGRRCKLLVEAISEVERARVCRVQRLLGSLARRAKATSRV